MICKFRAATLEDCEELAQLDRLCFDIPWSKESFEEDLIYPEKSIYLVVEDQTARIIGYAGMILVLDEGHVTNIAVHPEFRGQGIGYDLVRRLLDQSEKAGMTSQILEVRQSNEVAIDLYSIFGFQIVGVRKGYYRNNDENALVMLRSK